MNQQKIFSKGGVRTPAKKTKKKNTKKAIVKKKTKTKARKTTKKAIARKKKTPMNFAVLVLVLNLIIPGVGTLVAGKNQEGFTQLGVYVLGVLLTFTGIGLILIIAMWVWALFTSIQVIQEAQ